MSRIVKVSSGDYIVQTGFGGNIILDTGSGQGTGVGLVTITGNLTVLGNNTTVDTTNLSITDNLIVVNSGETGAGITLRQAGLQIDRGTLPYASFVFDEDLSHYNPITSTNIQGAFVIETEDEILSGLQLGAIVSDGLNDLIIDLQNGAPVIRIANSTNYESRVTDPNDIPNRKFVTDYVSATGGTANVTNIHYPLTGAAQTSITATTSTLDFVVGASLKAQISSAGVTINNIIISGDTITDTSANSLVLTANNNNIDINAVLNLDNQTVTPTPVSGKTALYTKATAGPGKTGLYFANNIASDELVSKSRAVLLSILL